MRQTFLYKAIDSAGNNVSGSCEASNRNEAINLIYQKDLTPITIKIASKPFFHFFSFRKNQQQKKIPSLHQKHILIFTDSCQSLLQSGFSIDQAILTIHKTSLDNNPLKEFCLHIFHLLEEGKSLSQSLQESSTVFSKLYINLVLAGEQSGQIEPIFNKLSIFLNETNEFKKTIKMILIYPFTIVIISILSIGIILKFIVPRFTEIFADFDKELPFITKIIIQMSHIFRNYFLSPISIIILIMLFTSFFWIKKSLYWKKFWYNILIKLPYIGTLHKKIILSSFCSTLSMLLKGGIKLVPAFTYAEQTVDSYKISQTLSLVKKEITKGVPFHKAILQYPKVFPQIFGITLSVGEKTAHMEKSLEHVAELFKKDVQRQAKLIITTLSPILILVIGGIIAFFIIGTLLPLIQATEMNF